MNPPAPTRIEIVLNGEARRIPRGRLLPELIADIGLPPASVLVEHNGRALLRSEWNSVSIGEGDRLEFLRIVAGG